MMSSNEQYSNVLLFSCPCLITYQITVTKPKRFCDGQLNGEWELQKEGKGDSNLLLELRFISYPITSSWFDYRLLTPFVMSTADEWLKMDIYLLAFAPTF